MRGFILNLKRVREEDLIVVVLTPFSVKSYYRFYGSRHSILQIWNLIDFEEVKSNGFFLDRIKGVSQIPFDWIYSKNRLLIWQNLIKSLYFHLKDSSNLDSFYFELLLKIAKRWNKQNPKRLFCEAYCEILRFEGRLSCQRCSICNKKIDSKLISISKNFITSHPECVNSFLIDREKIKYLFTNAKTTKLEDSQIELLYNIALAGFD